MYLLAQNLAIGWNIIRNEFKTTKTLKDNSLLIAMMYQPWGLCDDSFNAWSAANNTLPAKNTLHTLAAKLWQVMRMFKIPDVDFFKQIYEGATVRLAPNDEESATITFNTGVAQGGITSPKLFNIFINALLRMLTEEEENKFVY